MIRMTWRGWLKRFEKRDAGARILLGIGGVRPADTRNRIGRDFLAGRITNESRKIRMKLVQEWYGAFEAAAPVVGGWEAPGWRDLGDGNRMRRTINREDA